MQKWVGILYATHIQLPHCTIYSAVRSDERSWDSAIVSSIHLILAGRKKKKPDKFIKVRKVDSFIFFPKSSEMQPMCVYLATSRHNDLMHLCKVHLENKRFVLERLNAVILVRCWSYQSVSVCLCRCCNWWWHTSLLRNYITLCNQGIRVQVIRTQRFYNTLQRSMEKKNTYCRKPGWWFMISLLNNTFEILLSL